MVIEITDKMARHLNSFTNLKKHQVGARSIEAFAFIEDALEEVNRVKSARSMGAVPGELTRVWALVRVKNCSGYFKDTVEEIKAFKPKKGARQVLDARIEGKDLIIETENTAPVQCVDDVKGWLEGKSLGQGQRRSGYLNFLTLMWDEVIIVKSRVTKVKI